MYVIWFTITGLRDPDVVEEIISAANADAKVLDSTAELALEPGKSCARVRVTASSARVVGKIRRALNMAVIDAGGSMRLGR